MKEYQLRNSNIVLRYHDLPGKDVPIIFIHGLGCASSFDYPQIASMSSLGRHRRILVDLLGSGFSDKPEQFNYSIDGHAEYLAEFISHFDFDAFVIYGHSMGGAVSIALASRCCEGLQALILSEANLDAGGGFFSKRIASYSEQEYLQFGHDEIIQACQKENNKNWAASLSMTYPMAVYRESKSLLAGQSPSWREMFYGLETVKTYIFGNSSLPDPDLEILAGHNINIEIVPDAEHSMAWENPEGLAIAISTAIPVT